LSLGICFFILQLLIMDADCIVCLESNKVAAKKSFYFVKNKIYMIKCNCVFYTHTQCMQTWLEHTPKCPICRCNLPCYQGKLFILLCKAFVKSCIIVFLIMICIIHISTAVTEEIQDNFNITTCRYINNTIVKSI